MAGLPCGKSSVKVRARLALVRRVLQAAALVRHMHVLCPAVRRVLQAAALVRHMRVPCTGGTLSGGARARVLPEWHGN